MDAARSLIVDKKKLPTVSRIQCAKIKTEYLLRKAVKKSYGEDCFGVN